MGALDGYKVLDFTTLLPGPYATMTLADLGAEVLKVSSKDKYDLVVNWPPVIEGTQVTGAQAWLGRGKKTIHLNLKKPEAVEAVKKLVMDYDIIVEQFRPGVMEKLGLSYEQLREVNPRIIYCSITGYGQNGPLAMRAGHDINYMARSGIAASAGRKQGGPSLYNFQIADVAGGALKAPAAGYVVPAECCAVETRAAPLVNTSSAPYAPPEAAAAEVSVGTFCPSREE